MSIDGRAVIAARSDVRAYMDSIDATAGVFDPARVVDMWTFTPRSPLLRGVDPRTTRFAVLHANAWSLETPVFITVIHRVNLAMANVLRDLKMPLALAVDIFSMGALAATTDQDARDVGLAFARLVAAGELSHLPETADDHHKWVHVGSDTSPVETA
jgi:hypothetical protein